MKRNLLLFITILSFRISFAQNNCATPESLYSTENTDGALLTWTYDAALGSFYYDFDDASFGEWTTIDADYDGYNWEMSYNVGLGHNGSAHHVMSASYDGIFDQALFPDNYLVSPQSYVFNNSVLSFYVCAQDAGYPAEHYGVAISTNSNDDPDDFSTIWEETLSAKNSSTGTLRGNTAQGNWYLKTVDLSEYSGQRVYIAIRHFDSSDQFYIDIDDIRLEGGEKRHRDLDHFIIYRSEDGVEYHEIATAEPNENGFYSFQDYPGFGSWYYQVTALHHNGSQTCESDPASTFIQLNCKAPAELRAVASGNDICISWKSSPTGSNFSYNFDQSLENWTLIDADGDGENWEISIISNMGHNGSPHYAMSESFSPFGGSRTPDNYLVSPLVTVGDGSAFSFYVRAHDSEYPAEHYSVAISTNGNQNPNDFVTIWEETLTAKGRETGRWFYKNFDLSAFAGQQLFIALRHFNCTDNSSLDIDDIALSSSGKRSRFGQNNRSVDYFTIYRSPDNSNYETIATIDANESNDYSFTDSPEIGTWYYKVNAHNVLSEDFCESSYAKAFDNPEVDYVVVDLTSIDNLDEEGILLYPNPAHDKVIVSAEGLQKVSIINSVGQCVYHQYLSQEKACVSLSNFNSGLYKIIVKSSKGQFTKSLLITK